MRAEHVVKKSLEEIAYSPHYRVVLAMGVYGLTPVAKLVLVSIAEATNTDHGGASWYSQATIAAEIGCSRETVNRAFHELMWRGLISRHGGDMRIFRTSEKLPVSKSSKAYLNLQELIAQCDPVTGEQLAREFKAQESAKRKRKAVRRDRVSHSHLNDVPEPRPPAQVWEEPAHQVEPAGDLPDLEETTSEQLPPLSLADTSKPVESVALVSGSQQDNGKSHPWFESEDLEDERARQLAALARYEESA